MNKRYYLKRRIIGETVESVGIQKPDSFVKYQNANNIIVLTDNFAEAQGILSPDRSIAYQLKGKELIPLDLEFEAEEISEDDYIHYMYIGIPTETPDDTEPEETEVIPQQNPTEEYEALTKRIAELQAELSAITQLLEEKLNC